MKLSTIAFVTALALTPTLAFAQQDSSERATGAVGGATGGSAGGGDHLGVDAVRHGRTGTVGSAPDARSESTSPAPREPMTERGNAGPGGTAR